MGSSLAEGTGNREQGTGNREQSTEHRAQRIGMLIIIIITSS
jgi:hypothetical protein